MRKIITRSFFCLALLACAVPCYASLPGAAEIWEKPQVPKIAQERNLHCIYFVDAKHGCIVGDEGLCLMTNDGGATWQTRETGSKATLRCVQFQDAQTGWIGGDGDKSSPNIPLLHIIMRKKQRFVKPGTLLRTADGGKTWKTSWIPTNFEIHCIEASAAPWILVGTHSGAKGHLDGDFLTSRVGGKTGSWNLDPVGGRCCRSMSAVRRVHKERWVAVGAANDGINGGGNNKIHPLWDKENCRALYSDDSGKTWKFSKGSDGKLRSELRALAVGKNRAILTVGDEGVILRSQDTGITWEPVKRPTETDLMGVSWCGPLAIAVGIKGTAILGRDGGKSWEAVPTNQTQDLCAVAVAGDYVIAVGKKGTILRAKVSHLANPKSNTAR